MMASTYHEHNSELGVFCCIPFGSIGIDGTALVQQLFDNFYTAQYDHWPTANHNAVDRPIFPGPFGELNIFFFARDLVQRQVCIFLEA